MTARRNPTRLGGFTLFEVLLAIALSATLLALLVSAINQFLFRVDNSRKYIEEAHLARGVLEMIGEDLRCMAVAYEQETGSAASNAESQALFDVEQTDSAPPPITPITDESLRPQLGVSGDPQNLQVDVLRVRPYYTMAEDTENPMVMMSVADQAVTSVRYLLTEQGLVRQEIGREESIRADQQGQPQIWDEASRVVAPEVADLRFRYHDGLEAMEYWDIEERQGALPIAVEVRIGLREPDADQTSDTLLHYYRLTVALPVPPGSAAAGDSTTEDTTGA